MSKLKKVMMAGAACAASMAMVTLSGQPAQSAGPLVRRMLVFPGSCGPCRVDVHQRNSHSEQQPRNHATP